MAVTFPLQGPQGTPQAGTDPSVIPYTASTVTATSTAGGTLLATVPDSGAPVVLTNSATATVYLGNQGVTTTTGYALAPSASVLVSYEWAPDYGGASCSLYGIVASTSSAVTVLQVTAGAWPGIE